MRQGMQRCIRWLPLVGLALSLAASLPAQLSPGSKTVTLKYNTSIGPSTLTAAIWNDPCCAIWLRWPAVIGAEKYRVTRSSPGVAETILFEGSLTSFVSTTFGYTCTALPNIAPTGCVFSDFKAAKGVSYTYRVWAIYPGPVVSPPSPSSSATLP